MAETDPTDGSTTRPPAADAADATEPADVPETSNHNPQLATDDDGQPASVPHSRYVPVERATYRSQRDVMEAFEAGLYPTRVGDRGTLRSSPNFYAEQHDDGTGTVRHYRTREAIRTRNGLTITNQQCWATRSFYGNAHCTRPDDADGIVPLDAVESFLADDHDVHDITAVYHQGRTWRHYVAHAVAVVADDYGVYYGVDESHLDRKHRHFMVRLSPSEVDALDLSGHGAPADALDYLTPAAVRTSDREVVHSGEFTKTRLDDDEREAHLAAGGQLADAQSRWRDERVNRQYHRADMQGDVIVRHGEYFLIPRPDADPTPGRPASARPLGSHYARDYGHDDDGTVYVRGTVGHSDRDHNMVHLGETWHEAVTHGRDALTYRVGIPEDRLGGRGGGGWD